MSGVLSAAASGLLLPGQTRPISQSLFAVPNGLVGYFGLDVDCLDFTNGFAFDLTKTYSNGILNTLPASSLIISPVGHGLTFNGSISNIQLIPATNRITKFSTAFWYRPTAHPASGTQYTHHSKTSTAGDHRNFSFDHRGSSTPLASECLGFVYRATGGGALAEYARSFVPTLSVWTHIVWTVDFTKSPTVVGSYVNGISGTVLSSGATTSQPDVAPTQVEMIGSINSGDFLTGSMGEFRIYNRLLDPWEVIVLYQAGLAGSRYSGRFAPQIAALPALFVSAISTNRTALVNNGFDSLAQKVRIIGY